MTDKANEDFNFVYFKNFNVDLIKDACISFDKEWLVDQSRQNMIYPDRRNPHLYTNTYIVQDHELDWRNGEKFEPVMLNQDLYDLTFPIIKELEEKVSGKAARVLFIKLNANKDVTEHTDSGDYLNTVRRFHIPIITNENVSYTVNAEKINMKEGECWEINNRKPHSVDNSSNLDRIHLLIDIMPEDKFKVVNDLSDRLKLKVFHDFVSKEDIDFFMKWIDDNAHDLEKFRHRVGYAFNSGLAVRALFPDERPPNLFKDLEPIITKYADKFMKFQNEYMNDGRQTYFYGVSLTRLSKDIQLRLHQDVHNDFSTLAYSAVMYLNDDYEGGDSTFLEDFVPPNEFPLYEDSMNGVSFKPRSGDFSIFRADLWHGGKRIMSGNRYAVILWSTTEKEYEFAGFDSDIVLAKINPKAAVSGYK